ncbi:cytochrome c family protein [Ostreiculturibacter nitratireducens]|uniref:c-type cytochrome n=1 Tax=Ostreiculturibacter nitratireducens TaxID=3075226 RepID=UPI0031B57575
MIDTMTVTKAGGALCGALLIFLLANWGAESLYTTGGGGHGEEAAQAYTIATDEGAGEAAAAEEGPSFEEVFASADAAAGEKVFGKCKACHKVDGTNGTGPHLDGVVNRAVGGVDGFGYSATLAEHGGAWTPDALNQFLENPKGYAPGTKMSFAGLPKVEDRANLVAYLQGLGG